MSSPWDALASPANGDLAYAGAAPPGNADMSHAGNADLAYAGAAVPPWLKPPPGVPPEEPPPDVEEPPPVIPPPAASFAYDPPAPGPNTMMTFDASGSAPGSPDYPLTAWDWLFDGTDTRTGQTVTWRTPGGHSSYPAVLTVTAADGQTGTADQVITV